MQNQKKVAKVINVAVKCNKNPVYYQQQIKVIIEKLNAFAIVIKVKIAQNYSK